MISGVQGVESCRRFPAERIQLQQFDARLYGSLGEHLLQGGRASFDEEGNKRFGALPSGERYPEGRMRRSSREILIVRRASMEGAACGAFVAGPFHVGPGGVLSEIRTHDHLKLVCPAANVVFPMHWRILHDVDACSVIGTCGEILIFSSNPFST